MDKLITFIPSKYFPATNTQAYKFLCLLAGGDSVHYDVILRELGFDPRSARQHLVSDKFGLHWNIINSGGKKAVYSLDPRHLSGDSHQDYQARLECKAEQKRITKDNCKSGVKRLDRALKESRQAFDELFRKGQFDMFESDDLDGDE